MKYTFMMIFHPGPPPGGAAERCRGEGDLQIPVNCAAATQLTEVGEENSTFSPVFISICLFSIAAPEVTAH